MKEPPAKLAGYLRYAVLAAGESVEEMVTGYRGRVSPAAIREAVRLVTTQFLTSLPALEPIG